jgi:hypothetical protein
MSELLPVYPDTVTASLKSEQGGYYTSLTTPTASATAPFEICRVGFFDLAGAVTPNPAYVLATCSLRINSSGNDAIAFRFGASPIQDLAQCTLFSSDFAYPTTGVVSPYFASTTLFLTRGIDYTDIISIGLVEDTNEYFNLSCAVSA